MRTHRLKRIGIGSALAVLWVAAGGAALGQTPAGGGAGDGGSDTSSNISKYADMKVTIDAENKRLVEVIPPLMKSVGAEFTIDADVKNTIVSSHLSNVKLQTVLDVLLRSGDIPVQVTFEKGLYHFAKKVETAPEPPRVPSTPARPLLPEDSVLPPPPPGDQKDVDVHNVQTYDLLRVLNGLFNIPIGVDPSDPDESDHRGARNGYGNVGGSYSGFTNSSSHGITGRGITNTSSSGLLGTTGNGSSQQRNGSGTITVFGHPIHFGG